MNELIYLSILIITMLSLYLAKKLKKTLGLTIIFLEMSLISFILAFKYITLSTIHINSNSITYMTMFASLYLLLETTNKSEVKKIVNLNFLVSIFSAILLWIMTRHTISLTDTIGINIKNVFGDNYRILIIYPFTTLISNYLLIWMYNKIKNLYDNTFITMVTTYLLIGIIEGIIYTIFVYNNILTIKVMIQLILSTYMIRLIITVIYSLFLTLIYQKKVQNE